MKKPNSAALVERSLVVQYLRQQGQKQWRAARRTLLKADRAPPAELLRASAAVHAAAVLFLAASDLEAALHREGAAAAAVKAKPATTKGAPPNATFHAAVGVVQHGTRSRARVEQRS